MVGWQSVRSSQANSSGEPFHAVDGNILSCFTVKGQRVSTFAIIIHSSCTPLIRWIIK